VRQKQLSRRGFLRLSAAAATGALVAACVPATPVLIEKEVIKEVPVEKPVVVEKEVAKVVEKEVPKEVIKEVPVEKIVEKIKEVPVEKVVIATPMPAAPVQIRFSSVGWGGWLSDPWMELVDRFSESQSAIQIPNGYEDVAEGYQKVMAQAVGAVAADVYMFETKYMHGFASRGFFVPLDEYIAVSDVIKEEYYFADDWRQLFWGGRQYLAPFDNSPAMIWYNKDVFEKAGVDYPPNKFGQWKWTDFLDTALKLTRGEGAERIYGWAGERWWVYFLPWVWSNGGWLLNEEKTQCVIDMPETVEALHWAQDLVHKHKVQPTSGELIPGGNSAMFYMGRAAMAQRGTWWAIDLKAQEGLRWNVAPMSDGKAGAFLRSPLDAWGIWTGSQHRDAAWEFIEFLSRSESLELLTKAGLSVSRKDVMLSDVFLKQEPTDVDWYLFVDALDGHIRPHPDTAIFTEMQDLITPAWEAVLDGASTVEEMVSKVKDPINELLADCIEKGFCEG